jgi:hypothetical protein
MARNRLRSAIAAAESSPCFVLARRALSIPSFVLGPVLRPPCSLQRPFRMAGEPQALPRRFLVPLHFPDVVGRGIPSRPMHPFDRVHIFSLDDMYRHIVPYLHNEKGCVLVEGRAAG